MQRAAMSMDDRVSRTGSQGVLARVQARWGTVTITGPSKGSYCRIPRALPHSSRGRRASVSRARRLGRRWAAWRGSRRIRPTPTASAALSPATIAPAKPVRLEAPALARPERKRKGSNVVKTGSGGSRSLPSASACGCSAPARGRPAGAAAVAIRVPGTIKTITRGSGGGRSQARRRWPRRRLAARSSCGSGWRARHWHDDRRAARGAHVRPLKPLAYAFWMEEVAAARKRLHRAARLALSEQCLDAYRAHGLGLRALPIGGVYLLLPLRLQRALHRLPDRLRRPLLRTMARGFAVRRQRRRRAEASAAVRAPSRMVILLWQHAAAMRAQRG